MHGVVALFDWLSAILVSLISVRRKVAFLKLCPCVAVNVKKVEEA